MQTIASSRSKFAAALSFWLLAAFLVMLLIAGGASRADVAGQVVIRFVAWAMLLTYVIFSPRFEWQRVRPLAILLTLSVVLVAAHLVPLPPSIWTELPGRELLEMGAQVIGQPQPWRPLSISPGATANSLGSLIVPVVVLVLAANLTREQQWKIARVLLVIILTGGIIGLLQASGARFDNPLINNVGAVSGNFANRNHFALALAIGCVLALASAGHVMKFDRWNAIVTIGIVLFLLLMLLATGSRMGLLLGAIGMMLGLTIARTTVMRQLRSLPRLVTIGLVVGTLALIAIVVTLSITLDRAASLDRAFSVEAVDDLRSQVAPVIIESIGRYFPVGAGFGTFDPAYRIVEPDALLQSSYLNHAHNDWLEVVLDGGLPGGALMLGAIVWWVIASLRIWRSDASTGVLARAGSIIILLILMASLLDYPARTPIIMATLTLAAVWLAQGFAQPRANYGEA